MGQSGKPVSFVIEVGPITYYNMTPAQSGETKSRSNDGRWTS